MHRASALKKLLYVPTPCFTMKNYGSPILYICYNQDLKLANLQPGQVQVSQDPKYIHFNRIQVSVQKCMHLGSWANLWDLELISFAKWLIWNLAIIFNTIFCHGKLFYP